MNQYCVETYQGDPKGGFILMAVNEIDAANEAKKRMDLASDWITNITLLRRGVVDYDLSSGTSES